MRLHIPWLRTARLPLVWIVLSVLTLSILAPLQQAQADTTDSGFSLQVSPSPLVATINPGTTTTLELQIRNTNSTSQSLQMGLRSFSVAAANGQVTLGKSAPTDIASFVHFSDPVITLEAGQLFTEHITIDTPADAGFTYSFAITVAQKNPPKAKGGNSAIQGSVAVFTLLSVNRPGAVRKLELIKLSASKRVYEYLPATISLTFKNAGNTLGQPKGTIFIQRSTNSQQPLASLAINDAGSYILPNSSRTISASWNDGFPHYKTVTELGKAPQTSLTWGGSDVSKFRFGRYVAKVVAVYDNGTSDVPLTAEISFWVIPWRLLGIIILIFLLIVVGGITIIRNSTKALKPKRSKKPESDARSNG